MRRFFATVTSPPTKQFTLKVIESYYVGQRLDKLVMSKLSVPWSVAHMHVREKNVFVRSKAEEFVVKEIEYKI
jgi:hypothetical protein